VVLADEVVRLISTASNDLFATDAASALQSALDVAFIDPSYGGVADISPPSITHGATRLTSGGATLAAVDADLKSMVDTLTTASMTLQSAAWIFHPRSATSLAFLRGSGGAPAFPGITAKGGTLLGIPVVTSEACSSAGSPGQRFAALVEASEILYADDNRTAIEYSGTATLQMNDAPSTGAQPQVSLWQQNLLAIKTTKFASWAPRRSGAVAVLESLSW
jgi:HK97 family phage major capsid protein